MTGVVSDGFLILAEQDIPYCQSLNATQPPGRRLRCPRQRQITGPLLPLAQDQATPTKELSAVQAEDSTDRALRLLRQNDDDDANLMKKRVREKCDAHVARHQTRRECD